jgi:regulator of nucleoside diphosphate kinase
MARKIYITKPDFERLSKTVYDMIGRGLEGKEYLEDLKTELDRAVVVDEKKIPADVITMNTKAVLLMDGTDRETVTLVYPNEIDPAENRISVLSPIGTAILGYREGERVKWKVPDGTADITVEKVLSQPEASVRKNERGETQ